ETWVNVLNRDSLVVLGEGKLPGRIVANAFFSLPAGGDELFGNHIQRGLRFSGGKLEFDFGLVGLNLLRSNRQRNDGLWLGLVAGFVLLSLLLGGCKVRQTFEF